MTEFVSTLSKIDLTKLNKTDLAIFICCCDNCKLLTEFNAKDLSYLKYIINLVHDIDIKHALCMATLRKDSLKYISEEEYNFTRSSNK